MTNLAEIPAALLMRPPGFHRTGSLTSSYADELQDFNVYSAEAATATPTTTIGAYAPPAERVRVEASKLPPVISAILPRIVELSLLQPDWDSYGARPLEIHAVTYLLETLQRTKAPNLPTPQVFPTTSGGLQLEWDRGPLHLEFRVVSGQAVLYLEDEDAETEESETISSARTAAEALARHLTRLFPEQ